LIPLFNRVCRVGRLWRISIGCIAVLLAVAVDDYASGERRDITQLIEQLERDNPAEQSQAAESLAWAAEDLKDSASQLQQLLRSKHANVRLAGVRALWAIQGGETGRLLGQVVRGWMNYHAVPGNLDRIKQFIPNGKRSSAMAKKSRSRKVANKKTRQATAVNLIVRTCKIEQIVL